MVEFSWSITFDDPHNPKVRKSYRGIKKKCDNCQKVLEVNSTFKYNNSLLCERCYNITVERFGGKKVK